VVVTILRAGSLLLSDESGDVDAGGAAGLYVAETRLLARWALRLDGRRLRVAGAHEEASRRIVALLLPGRRHAPSPLFVRRDQRVAQRGLTETIRVTNVSAEHRETTLSIELEVDFADQFAVRSDGRVFDTSAAERSADLTADGTRFSYRHVRGDRAFDATARIAATPQPTGDPPVDGVTTLSWPLSLQPQEQREFEIRVERDLDSPSIQQPQPGLFPGAPPFDLSRDRLEALRRRSLADLDALLVPSPTRPGESVIGAGAPWFLTLFGRDSLLTAELVAHRAPGLVENVLRALADTQGRRDDPASLEQPGRIVHELRRSELATLGMVPYGRYYGSVDATPLFLVVLGRAAQRATGRNLAVELEQAARAAVAWIRGPGGVDDHGFLLFTPDPNGLLNQGWKDSPGATCFADGRLAAGSIALCEVQGYAWEGLMAAARMARDVWADADYAAELHRVAVDLRARFLPAFWLADEGFPALALDGNGRQVDAIASNAGHLLWSGMLPADLASVVTRRLLTPEFSSGWGVRTLATGQVPYSPLSYHEGSVWPHDTMLAALGMVKYGLVDEAHVLATGVAAAGAHLDNRLPELYAGFSATELPFPVALELAGVPQAWASAAGVAAADLIDGSLSR
jgi:glycogen debranching enzyme